MLRIRSAPSPSRGEGKNLTADGGFDRGERGIRLRAVGPAGLRHVGAPAPALAAERLGPFADEIDRIQPAGEIAGDADHDARLAVLADADDRDHARAKLLLALVSEAFQVLDVDAGDRARHQLDVADLAHAVR